MTRIYKRWQNMNIKYKLFSITTALLVALALLIYGMLYFLLPKYYHRYKIEALQDSVKQAVAAAENEDISRFEEDLYRMSKEQNLAILLRDQEGNIIYGKNEVVFLKYSKYLMNSLNSEYRLSTEVNIKEMDESCVLDIIMPLQPINEANKVLRNLVPFTIFAAILIGILGAYIYSNTITKPLIEIIEKERREEENRREFIATISHELKTPITIISGQLEGMIYNIGKYKDRDKYLKESYTSTQELKDLVNEMIEISKTDIMSASFKPTTLSVKELVEVILKRQEFLIDEKNLKTRVAISSDAKINADKDKFSKALYNIINNAIKYTPEGENINIRFIERGFRPSILEVENTGITISDESLKNIFNPFFRVEKSRSRRTGGSGLGLYLTSQILAKHGFEYKMTNRGNAVLFTIEFTSRDS
ncbi:ATPase/histidine kinase/DNA gyrase B/HSP90 domain protein [Peptacetobacter hiranonis DSM 13275]|uniref:histidine kinase n=2 Tax=Peptacetobacter TaxID=2743582 RepID=B6FXB2_PEPHT|nr:ATPase/histidine kinase/DNA gyrase B/HSP90 domain protein [Peptacetobacter hiranonis DSM 13275]QEK20544.1 Sensor histidine kinase WalK [Peptacetobacter hiranonis]